MKTTERVRRINQTFTFGEYDDGKYGYCDRCDGKTMLIIAPSDWRVDSEAFTADEPNPDGTPDDVTVHEEITAHYCAHCERIVSLSFNAVEPT